MGKNRSIDVSFMLYLLPTVALGAYLSLAAVGYFSTGDLLGGALETGGAVGAYTAPYITEHL